MAVTGDGYSMTANPRADGVPAQLALHMRRRHRPPETPTCAATLRAALINEIYLPVMSNERNKTSRACTNNSLERLAGRPPLQVSSRTRLSVALHAHSRGLDLRYERRAGRSLLEGRHRCVGVLHGSPMDDDQPRAIRAMRVLARDEAWLLGDVFTPQRLVDRSDSPAGKALMAALLASGRTREPPLAMPAARRRAGKRLGSGSCHRPSSSS